MNNVKLLNSFKEKIFKRIEAIKTDVENPKTWTNGKLLNGMILGYYNSLDILEEIVSMGDKMDTKMVYLDSVLNMLEAMKAKRVNQLERCDPNNDSLRIDKLNAEIDLIGDLIIAIRGLSEVVFEPYKKEDNV